MTKTRGDDDVRGQPYLARLLATAGGTAEVTDLFDLADLPVGDFYAQLAWEVRRGLIVDDRSSVVRSAPAAQDRG
jgi:type I restriction enzyme, S subunit